jgi:hypothetical protein
MKSNWTTLFLVSAELVLSVQCYECSSCVTASNGFAICGGAVLYEKHLPLLSDYVDFTMCGS